MDFLAQLQAIANAIDHAPAMVGRFNPRPLGVIQPGRSSELVLKCLREHGGMMTEGQIRFRTGLNHAKTSWALLYLLRQGLIEFRQNPARNGRYRRYRAKLRETEIE
jgi:DNA-binding transcriptional ArsR family regulator